ncbi:MAG: DUF2851 family protein [Victivallales bacterium]|nr:DUF2851 family protein [Victivallales bacterium]
MEKCPFSERFLQIIWNERLVSPRATCTDGQKVHAISVGLWNRLAGPDFHDAVVVIGGELKRGDIEVHRNASEWFSHGHHQDGRYSNVVLHVVWQDDGGPPIPTLELKSQLQPSWGRLFQEVASACYPAAREVPPGACALRWALTDDERLREILAAAGTSRMLRRGQRLLRLAARVGEDQALYEQVFEGLGYAANREPFRKLAQSLPLESMGKLDDRQGLLALFFGAAGLLPDTTQVEVLPELADFVADAWRIWWRSGRTAPAITWNLSGSRPLNSVERRLAGGVELLCHCDGSPTRWLRTCVANAGGAPRRLLRELLAPLRLEGPWEGIRDFVTRLPRPVALLGRERLTDLALNTYLPFLAAKAEVEEDTATLTLARSAWEMLPRGQENHLLKDAVRRFLSPPSRSREVLRTASQQQGMMDIFQNFCLALDHACIECPFIMRN